jgi:Do/DeqQ family serine protease
MRVSFSPWFLVFSSIACAAAGVRFGHGSGDAVPGSETTSSVSVAPQGSFAPMLANAMPAIVGVAVRGEVTAEDENKFRPDSFFHRFSGGSEGSQKQAFEAAGSGVIVDGDKGWILTNNHLVENAQEMMVVLADGTHLVAETVGRDPDSDVAVIRVRHAPLPALPLGDSDALRVGDWVVAIGNPFGLAQTATHGIVSGLGRSGLGIGPYEDFIQTDAPINPGNSGGALVDPQGRLVGLNTAIVGPASVGIGFAIPVNVARDAMKQIVEHGEVRRGHIGVVARDLTTEIAQGLGLSRKDGAAIVEVTEDSPAAKAGVLVGDVFLSVDGAPILSSSDLRAKIGVRPLGDTLKVELWRAGKSRTIDVAIGER